MQTSHMLDQEKSVLRWGGLSGVLAGVMAIVAIVVVGVLLPADPTNLEGWVTRFPEVMAIRIVENVSYLMGLILALPLYLALAWAMRKESLAPALFGSGLAAMGLMSMVASATPHVAHAALSEIYVSGEANGADLVTLGVVFQAIRGMLDAMLYVGFLVAPMGHLLLAIGMLKSQEFSQGIGWACLVLGGVGLVAGILQMIDPASMIGAGAYLSSIVYYVIAGLSVYRLSRAS